MIHALVEAARNIRDVVGRRHETEIEWVAYEIFERNIGRTPEFFE